MRTARIGISLGDVTGIGPEVTLKALAAEANSDDTRYLLIGDVDYTRALNRKLGLNLSLEELQGALPNLSVQERAQRREGGTAHIKVTQLGAKQQDGTAVLAVLGKKPEKEIVRELQLEDCGDETNEDDQRQTRKKEKHDEH